MLLDSDKYAEGDTVDASSVLSDVDATIDFESLGVLPTTSRDVFATDTRKAWDKSQEARCDFTYRLRLTRRSNVNFISIWQKTLYGRTLTDIKSDVTMVTYFATAIAPVIRDTIGCHLSQGDWALVTTPKRRHLTRNFATLISVELADLLGIPFYEDVAFCRSKERVNAVFTLGTLPMERNIIVFDDFVTTGQTLKAMYELLNPLGKNLIFFAGINNKL